MSIKNTIAKLKLLHSKLNGSTLEFDLSRYNEILTNVKSKELSMKGATDAALKELSQNLRENGIDEANPDSTIIEGIALVREVFRRVISTELFDEQIMGGAALCKGKLVEMQTGEGKTFTAVFPAFISALSGNGVHILTFNDYLAKRDALWMNPVYTFLGLSVGYIQEGMSTDERRRAYLSNVTYCTAKESGFDYLRDSMCYDESHTVHRALHAAIIDEADSILIDEARIPLVIAGATDTKKDNLKIISNLVRTLTLHEQFTYDEYARNVFLTEKGIYHLEKVLQCENLYDEHNGVILHQIQNALHAHYLLKIDRDYIVRNGIVQIVDEFTGRIADKRRWPDGLQEAVETKENCDTQLKGKILNSITLQHFLQLYPKICGMTATAQPAEEEFREFYNLHITVIPPHKKCIREDHADLMFTTKEEKLAAIVAEITAVYKTGRPILVGTQCVHESVVLATMLESIGIKCQLLNAKCDEDEAAIIAEAGMLNTVTISTNMAGRGTDIRLGGAHGLSEPDVRARGGLCVFGTNRFESKRIDNQLRGRSGRQGDPGASTFFISLEDDLFIKYRLKELLPSASEKQCTISTVQKEIDRIQRIIEGQNLDIKIKLCKYSGIIEQQRKIIHDRRYSILTDKNTLDLFEKISPDKYYQFINESGKDKLAEACRFISLCTIDDHWATYLEQIQDLKDSIHLRRIGGQDPLFEFRKLSIDLFENMLDEIDVSILQSFEKVSVNSGILDFKNAGLKTPAATWTYLINDNPFEHKNGLEMFSAIGQNAWAGMAWPLMMLLIFVKKLKNGRVKT